MKFYRGSPGAARTYVEQDRSRADDYYLAEGSGVATRYVASPLTGVTPAGSLTGEAYEKWVAGYDPETGVAKGRLRTDAKALRFVEVVVNGPKTWSLAAALHPEIADALDAAQTRAAEQIIGWVAEHATTRVGPKGRQVQVPVTEIEAAVVRHYTSRAGDPHRHLHLQINARVLAEGAWRGLHSVGMRDSLAAINGIGHAAVATDPEFRAVLTAHGFTLDPATGELTELAPYVGKFSARTAQIGRNLDRYEAEWRTREPRRRTRTRACGRRGTAAPGPRHDRTRSSPPTAPPWSTGGTRSCTPSATATRTRSGYRSWPAPRGSARIDRDRVVEVVLSRLGARRSAWNAADIRGEVEQWIARTGLVADAAIRTDLAEDLTARTLSACAPLLPRTDVPEHIRALTSREVLAVEADLVTRLVGRAEQPAHVAAFADPDGDPQPDAGPAQGPRVGCRAASGRRLARRQRPAAGRRGRCGSGQDEDPLRNPGAARRARSPDGRGHPDAQGSQGRRPRDRDQGVLRRMAGPPARLALGRRRSLDPRGLRPPSRTPCCNQVTCCSSTRPGCSTRTPPAPSSPSPTKPKPGSRSWVTDTSSPPSAAAASSTSPPAGPDPRPSCPSTSSTGSPTRSTQN